MKPFAMKHTLTLITALLAIPLFTHAQTVTLKPGDASLRVEIDGQLFTEYITKDTPRPFMYPLIGAAGVNVSRDFPMKKDVPGEERFLDHKHHRSLWFGHSKVNGIDFWGEYLVFDFVLTSPALDGYSYRLFKLRHKLAPYPAEFIFDSKVSRVRSREELGMRLRSILADPVTRRAVSEMAQYGRKRAAQAA